MWTAENRGRYDHKTKRYPSDLTDEEWGLVERIFRRQPRAVAIRHLTGAR
jgi:hypothetical protein